MSPARRSRRIYVRARTDPQYAQLWWPGLGAARLGQVGQRDGQTDRQTDGRIGASPNAPPPTAGEKMTEVHKVRNANSYLRDYNYLRLMYC